MHSKGRSPKGRATPSPRRHTPRTPPSRSHQRSASGGARLQGTRASPGRATLWDEPSSPLRPGRVQDSPRSRGSGGSGGGGASGLPQPGLLLADPPKRRATHTDSPLLLAGRGGGGGSGGTGTGANAGSAALSAAAAVSSTAGGQASTSTSTSTGKSRREKERARKKKARKLRNAMAAMAASPEFVAALAAVQAGATEAADASTTQGGGDDDRGSVDASTAFADHDAGGVDDTEDGDAVGGSAGGGAGLESKGDDDGGDSADVLSSSARLSTVITNLKRAVSASGDALTVCAGMCCRAVGV